MEEKIPRGFRMNPFAGLIQYIDDFFSENENAIIASKDIKIEEQRKKIAEMNDLDLEQIATIDRLLDENEALEKEISKTKPSEEQLYWDNKYPKADITYTGRTFGPSQKMIPIDVRLLITPTDFHIHDILKQNNLYIKDGNYEEGVPKIYNWIKNNFYSYAFDQNVFGISEFWEFPFEILEGKRIHGQNSFDCDSWANFQSSFYIAAGVPAWKVRVVIGNCKLGGHSTVYVHSDETNKFHHLNSTYGGKFNTKISQFPTTDDADTTDQLGIGNVWFSFTTYAAWHKFTSQAKEGYNKEGKDKFVIE